MKSFAGRIVVGAALAVTAGCSPKPLQPGSSGGGGIGTIGIDGGLTGSGGDGAAGGIGGGAAIDGGVATDAAWDAPFAGRRSYTVMSTLTPATGTDGAATGWPGWHVFTVVLDADQRTAIVGADASVTLATVVPTAEGFQVAGPISFWLGSGCQLTTVSYDALSFTFDPAGRLLGSGSGQMSTYAENFGQAVATTMSMTGDLDSVGPTLSLSAARDFEDPFTSFAVASSEPVPTDTWPLLRSQSGDEMALTPSSTSGGYVTAFLKPEVLLRYGETYRIDFAGVADFAGNPAGGGTTAGLGFTTVAAPPLIAADGFESVTAATLGGAQVLSGTGAPIISGTRSLYVPPVSGIGDFGNVTQLALRVTVTPGSKVLRFSYRDVNPGTTTTASFSIASVGGSIVGGVACAAGAAATTATIGGVQVTLSPIATMSIDLPDDASSEIVVARRIWLNGNCGGPMVAPVPGIIIDDMRTE